MAGREALLAADELLYLSNTFASLPRATIEASYERLYKSSPSEKAWQALLAELEDRLKAAVRHPPAAPSTTGAATSTKTSSTTIGTGIGTTSATAGIAAGKRKAEGPNNNNNNNTGAEAAVELASAAVADDSADAAVVLAKPKKAATGAGSGCVTLLSGDLFEAKTNLGHCISADARLGKGIATHFRSKFGGDAFVARIKELHKNVGECAAVLAGDRYVYNLVTKALYHHKPTYESLRASLLDMRRHMEANGVKTVALPHGFGCGLDGLDWPRVQAILEEVFDGSGLTVQVIKMA